MRIARGVLTVFLVAAMAWVGLTSGRGVGHVPAVWWANAVLLTIVLVSPRRERWLLIAAGYCGNTIAHLMMGDPISQVLLLSVCDTGEATFAVLAVQWRTPFEARPHRHLVRTLASRKAFRAASKEDLAHEAVERPVDLTDRGSLLRFVLLGVLLGPLLASSAAALILHALVGADIFTALRWFPPSALGMAIVTPLLLGLMRRETKALFAPPRIVKTLVYLGLLAATTLGIFSGGDFPLLFLIFPPVMFLVVELGVGGGALGACVVAAIGSAYTIEGRGALASGMGATLEERILILQMFLATAVLSVDVVGLVLGDLKRAAQQEQAAGVRLTDALETLEAVARVDATTRIANRRRLDEVLEEEWQRAIREGSTLSLLLLDVDHFKAYNDVHGHLAGDECLRLVAEIAGRVLRRPEEVIARFGGEEFAIVLPNTESQQAREVAEQVRCSIREAPVLQDSSPEGPLTVSVGCATASPRRGELSTVLVAAADRALYSAKRAGRDRVESADVAEDKGLDPAGAADAAVSI